MTQIKIHGGIIKSTSITNSHGTRQDFTNVGQYRFFIDVVELDGSANTVWSGDNYNEAIAQAHALSAEVGAPVRDCVLEVAS